MRGDDCQPCAQRAVIRRRVAKDGRAQATGGDAAALPDRYRLLHLLEGGFAEEAIVADAFPSRQTPVGCKAQS
jgi:hypothetical protein